MCSFAPVVSRPHGHGAPRVAWSAFHDTLPVGAPLGAHLLPAPGGVRPHRGTGALGGPGGAPPRGAGSAGPLQLGRAAAAAAFRARDALRRGGVAGRVSHAGRPHAGRAGQPAGWLGRQTQAGQRRQRRRWRRVWQCARGRAWPRCGWLAGAVPRVTTGPPASCPAPVRFLFSWPARAAVCYLLFIGLRCTATLPKYNFEPLLCHVAASTGLVAGHVFLV